MPTMNVSLTDDLAAFVAQQLEDGGYNNQSEVVRDGLRLLRSRKSKIQQLRIAVAESHADVAAGRTKPLTDDLLRDTAVRGAKRSAARKTNRT